MARFNFLPGSTHSARLERWLGKDQVDQISSAMRGFHGKDPIAIANIPGIIQATNDGDFVGSIKGGHFVSMIEYKIHRLKQAFRKIAKDWANGKMYTGFSSLSDLISEATSGGKQQTLVFGKTGVTGVANVANGLWDVGAQPAAGANAGATTGGTTAYDCTTAGGMTFTAPTGSDTTHITTAISVPTVANNLLLLHDRFYAVNHNIATQSPSVTGVPIRYQDTTSKSAFITAFVTTVLGGTPGTYQLTYVDQDGNTAENGTAQTLVAASIARRFPFAASVGNGWFIPINSGDTGVRKLTAITQNVATGTGNIELVLAKPLMWIPQGIANFPVIIDGINSAFNLIKIADASAAWSACLSLMEINKGATTATSYSGTITIVSG